MPVTGRSSTLTVMTYNVGNNLAEPKRLSRMLRVSGADLIGLQELSTAQALEVQVSLADVFPFQVLSAGGFAGKGLLSRLPLRQHELLWLYPDRPDLRVVVEAAGTALTILVGHPPPPRLRRSGLAFEPAAAAQIFKLARLALDSAPALLLGDLNMTARHAYYARMRAAGLHDAFAAAGVGRGSTLPLRFGHTRYGRLGMGWFSLPPLVRVDYIWHTAGLQARSAWIGDDAGSDHLPVLARLALC